MDIPNCLREYFHERHLREKGGPDLSRLPLRPATRDDVKALFKQLGRPRQYVEFFEIALNLGLSFVDVERYPISDKAIACLPANIAHRERALPVRIFHRTLFVAVPDPSDLGLLRDLAKAAGMRIVPAIADLEALERAINRYYPLD